VRIEELTVKAYRNISETNVIPSERLNFFVGPNGQGKTNLLEAIFFAIRGKSFRPYAHRGEIVPMNQNYPQAPEVSGTNVHLALKNSKNFPLDVQMRVSDRGRNEFFLNEKRRPSGEIAEYVPVVCFSPDDHQIIRGSPEARRGYLDDVFTDICPGYSEILSRFEKTLKSRNGILKTMRDDAYRGPMLGELKTWTEVYVNEAMELHGLRAELWPRFNERFQRNSEELFPADLQPIVLKPLWDIVIHDAVGHRELFSLLAESLERDIATGWTHRGPGRDDFSILTRGVEDSRTFASQGQARLLALTLKWLQAEWIREERQEIPIVLVDDFSSELDPGRRGRLLDYIETQKAQVFISSTERSLVDSGAFSDYKIWDCSAGKFNP